MDRVSGVGATQTPTWIMIASAVGTLSAVLVALYVQVFREWRRRPKLGLAPFSAADSDGVILRLKDEISAWIRLQVHNEPGRRTAEDVEVIVVSIARDDNGERPPPDEPPVDLGLLAGRTLKWADDASSRSTIPPGMYRRIDIAHASSTADDVVASGLDEPSEFWLTIHPPPQQSTRDRLPPGTYRLVLAITARDTPTTFETIRIAFTGRWHGYEAIWSDLCVRCADE